MRTTIAVALLLSAAGTAQAQYIGSLRPEVRPFVGASIPTGAQRGAFATEPQYGLQVALEVRPTLHLNTTFSWVPARAQFGIAQNRVNILAYGVGAELGIVEGLSGSWELRPFIGAGAGGRTYAYQAASLSDRTCLAGYASAGTEIQSNQLAVRLEARGNAFCFKDPMPGAASRTRYDIGMSFGLAYHIW